MHFSRTRQKRRGKRWRVNEKKIEPFTCTLHNHVITTTTIHLFHFDYDCCKWSFAVVAVKHRRSTCISNTSTQRILADILFRSLCANANLFQLWDIAKRLDSDISVKEMRFVLFVYFVVWQPHCVRIAVESWRWRMCAAATSHMQFLFVPDFSFEARDSSLNSGRWPTNTNTHAIHKLKMKWINKILVKTLFIGEFQSIKRDHHRHGNGFIKWHIILHWFLFVFILFSVFFASISSFIATARTNKQRKSTSLWAINVVCQYLDSCFSRFEIRTHNAHTMAR